MIVSGSTVAGTFSTGVPTRTIPAIAVNGSAELTVDGTAQCSGALTDTSRIIASDSTDPVSADDAVTTTITSTPAAPALTPEVTPTAVPAAGGFAENAVISCSSR